MNRTSKVKEFVSRLERLVEEGDSATLAQLRRSLAFEPGTYVYAFPFVERFTVGLSPERRKLYFLIAGLLALHPESNKNPREDFGRTLQRLYLEQDKSPSTERRFLALLEADDDQLPQHLRQLLNLLKAKGLTVNWERLLQDLINRQYHPEETKRRWAQSFYRPLSAETEAEEPVTTA